MSGEKKHMITDKNSLMKMKPLTLNDSMLIPKAALKSKVVVSPKELEHIQRRFDEKIEAVE